MEIKLLRSKNEHRSFAKTVLQRVIFDMEHNKTELIPNAYLLLSSLRSVGYSPETAIADIIDNSISAHSSEIKLNFIWDNEQTRIFIIDNGEGMSKEKLVESMRIGSADPATIRDNMDLGRFGMGMKTAAFSLGKKLTVVTKSEGVIADACWDLDYIEKTNGNWDLITDDISNGLVQHSMEILSSVVQGTVVVIEKLDSLIDVTDIKKAQSHFFHVVESIEYHLQLVFHRFIEEDKLSIFMHDHRIVAWNPFVLSNNATQELPEEKCYHDGSCIVIQPYVLPHKSKFKSDSDYEAAEGKKGWNAHQGIYVYRNRRLLVYGTWFGFLKKEAPFDLARIRLDIDSSCDFDWKIDIKKSKATPPLYIRDILEKAVVLCTQASANVYNSRGSYSKGPAVPNLCYVWEQRKNSIGKYSFYLNKKHPLLINIKSGMSEQQVETLNAYLALVENYSPVLQSGMIDYLQNSGGSATVQNIEKQRDLLSIKKYIAVFRTHGYADEEIQSALSEMKNYGYLKEEIVSLIGEHHD